MALRRADAAPNAAAKNPQKWPKKAGPYSCKKCGANLKTARSYKDHLKRHNERLYKCPLCPKAYSWSGSLRRHKKVVHSSATADYEGRIKCHAGKRECTCPHCLKSFHGEISLLKHIRKVHLTQEQVATNVDPAPAEVPVQQPPAEKQLASKKHTCHKCGKVLSCKLTYTVHMNLHSGKRPFKCSHCPKAYAGYHTLKRHRRLIHGLRSKDSAKAKADLLLTEKLIVSIPINVCVSETQVAKRLQEKEDKTSPHDSTASDSTLPAVGNVASQNKGASCQNFECNICGKVLTREFSYRGHMYTHGSNQPFQCSYCNRVYPYQSSLKKHIRLKHGIPNNLQHSQSALSTPAVSEEADSHSDPSGNDPVSPVAHEPASQPSSPVAHEPASQPSSPVAHEPASQPSSYQCGSCSKVLDSLVSYKTHLQQHSAKKTSFKCSVCSRSYRSVSQLWLHQRRQHVQFKRSANKPTSLPSKPSRMSLPKSTAPQLFPCSICRQRRVFKTASKLDAHTKKSHGPCPKCGRLLCSLTTYKAHMNLHLGRQPYACRKCPKRFYSANTLCRHMCLGKCSPETATDRREKEDEKSTAADPSPQCSIAQETVENFALKPVMVPHSCRSGQGYKCVLCGKVLSRMDSFKDHMNLHTGAQPFQCDECGESFSHHNQRKRHKRAKHAAMPTSRADQQSHASPPKQQIPGKQVTHSSPASCAGSGQPPTTECKTSIASVRDCCTGGEDQQNVPVDLEERQTSEAANKDSSESEVPDDLPVSIDIQATQDVANRGSPSREPVLTPSILESPDTHGCSEDNKPFKCGVCGVVLQQYTAYIAHMNKHTRKNTHKCSQCPMTCPSLASLRTHKRFKHSHSQSAGRRLLKCKTRTRVEGRGATTSCAAETSDQKLACFHCEKAYTRLDSLKRHLYVDHPAPPTPHVMRLRNVESSGNHPATEVVEKKPQESEKATQSGDMVERSGMFDVVEVGGGGKQEGEGSSALLLESCAAGGVGEWEAVCGEVQVGEEGEGEEGEQLPITTTQPDTILVKYGSWNVFFFKENS